MGSQLAKSDVNSRSRIINTSPSTDIHTSQFATDSNKSRTTIGKDIVVVNKGPSSLAVEQINRKLRLLKPVTRPLIAIGQTTVNPSFPQIDPQTIINIGHDLQAELRANSELIQSEQEKLIEKVRHVEQQTILTTNSFCTDKHRRATKAFENFSKFNEIDQLICRCEGDIDNLVTVLAKLNTSLPENLCLENFQLLS